MCIESALSLPCSSSKDISLKDCVPLSSESEKFYLFWWSNKGQNTDKLGMSMKRLTRLLSLLSLASLSLVKCMLSSCLLLNYLSLGYNPFLVLKKENTNYLLQRVALSWTSIIQLGKPHEVDDGNGVDRGWYKALSCHMNFLLALHCCHFRRFIGQEKIIYL